MFSTTSEVYHKLGGILQRSLVVSHHALIHQTKLKFRPKKARHFPSLNKPLKQQVTSQTKISASHSMQMHQSITHIAGNGIWYAICGVIIRRRLHIQIKALETTSCVPVFQILIRHLLMIHVIKSCYCISLQWSYCKSNRNQRSSCSK